MPARNVTTSSLAYNPADFEQEAAMEAQIAAQVAMQAQQSGGPTRPNAGAVAIGPTAGVPQTSPASPSGTPDQKGPTDTDSNPGVYGWLLAWGMLILLAILAARTQIGYRLIYYGLALLILFLVLTNYKWFQATLAPLQTVSIS